MSTTLTEAGERNFELLTSSTFYVVDAEFTATGDTARTNSIISFAIVPVRQGRIEMDDAKEWEMNPGVPISEESSAKHGFIDEAVKRKRRFDYCGPQILKALSEKNAVFVSHSNVDIHVLRAELTRLDARKTNGEAVKIGLDDLPYLPIIDTSRFAQTISYPGIGSRGVIGLAALCKLTGISNEKPHNAKSDAKATAQVLLELLAFAAQEKAHSDLGELLRKHNAKTTHNPQPEIRFTDHLLTEPELPAAHLSKHETQWDHRASKAELSSWVALAAECAEHRCQWLLDDAIIFSELNAAALLAPLPAPLSSPLLALLPSLTAPGQAATLVGALCEVVDSRERSGGAGLLGSGAIRWWGKVTKILSELPRCGAELSERCPACRRGEICGIDRIHQVVAETALVGQGKKFDSDKRGDLFRESHAARIRNWTPRYPELAAYAAWFAIKKDIDLGAQGQAQTNLGVSIELGLHQLEPRLALIVAEQMLNDAQAKDSLLLCDEVLSHRNTDPAFDEVVEWAKITRVGIEQQAKLISKPAPTHPRLSRPVGRVNPNPYSVL